MHCRAGIKSASRTRHVSCQPPQLCLKPPGDGAWLSPRSCSMASLETLPTRPICAQLCRLKGLRTSATGGTRYQTLPDCQCIGLPQSPRAFITPQAACQSGKLFVKKWCLEASAAEGLLAGSSVSKWPTKAAKGVCNCEVVSSPSGRWLRTCRSEEEDCACSGQCNRGCPEWLCVTYFSLTLFGALLSIAVGNGSRMRSMSAKCSRFSCVPKSNSPV
mmetsp:Transcript_77207/g.213485  ORF Transcript_77207/g.213485 Transcript_77207/m.213485 type:complete len:217 (-) Transcript_77207:1332-1982(-)